MRYCKFPGCNTKLSSYNPSVYCFIHQEKMHGPSTNVRGADDLSAKVAATPSARLDVLLGAVYIPITCEYCATIEEAASISRIWFRETHTLRRKMALLQKIKEAKKNFATYQEQAKKSKSAHIQRMLTETRKILEAFTASLQEIGEPSKEELELFPKANAFYLKLLAKRSRMRRKHVQCHICEIMLGEGHLYQHIYTYRDLPYCSDCIPNKDPVKEYVK